jgi:hypothetical protein
MVLHWRDIINEYYKFKIWEKQIVFLVSFRHYHNTKHQQIILIIFNKNTRGVFSFACCQKVCEGLPFLQKKVRYMPFLLTNSCLKVSLSYRGVRTRVR